MWGMWTGCTACQGQPLPVSREAGLHVGDVDSVHSMPGAASACEQGPWAWHGGKMHSARGSQGGQLWLF